MLHIFLTRSETPTHSDPMFSIQIRTLAGIILKNHISKFSPEISSRPLSFFSNLALSQPRFEEFNGIGILAFVSDQLLRVLVDSEEQSILRITAGNAISTITYLFGFYPSTLLSVLLHEAIEKYTQYPQVTNV